MTTYTVVSQHGTVQGRNLSVRDAAQTILTYDGHDYEIRKDNVGAWLDLWVSSFSRNSTLGGQPMVKSHIFGATEDEIYASVLMHANDWSGQSAMLDTDYDVLSKIDE